jgi:hypothetical protein
MQQVNYPFADFATRSNDEGDELPIDLLIDAVFYPPGNPGPLHLARVEVTGTEVIFHFSAEGEEFCSATASAGSPPSLVPILDPTGRTVGQLVCTVAQLQVVSHWSPGDHNFSYVATALVPDVVIPAPEVGVRGIQLESGELFTGPVIIVGEDGVQFQVLDRSGQKSIRVDAIGDPLFVRKSCTEAAGEGSSSLDVGPFLKSINNVRPDASGRFVIFPDSDIVDDTVLRIEPRANGLFLKLLGTRR